MNDLLQEGIAAVKTGDKDTGKKLLARVLQSDSHNEAAWLWLSCAVDEVARKRECLERVLTINSNNEQARLLLEKVNRWDEQVRAEQAQRAKQTQRKVNKEPQKTPTKKAQPPASNKTPQKKSRSGLMAVLGIIAVLAVSFYCCVSSPLSSPSLLQPMAIDSPTPTLTRTLTPATVLEWEGVYIGMPADDVLKIHPKSDSTEAPVQLGQDSEGLVVRWSYPGAYLIMSRWEQDGVYCYRVREIQLK